MVFQAHMRMVEEEPSGTERRVGAEPHLPLPDPSG